MSHLPVLLEEVVNGLDVHESDIVVDLTLGRAGHASILFTKNSRGHLYGFDQDKTALHESSEKLERIRGNFTLIYDNFKDARKRLEALGIHAVDKVLLDIGVSSPQFDDGERGFSYRHDAPLDMRMDQERNDLTAALIVNTYSEFALKEIFYRYAEHSYSPRVARKIVEAREQKPIETTFELVDIIKSALPTRELRKKGHPAKTFFQALRIVVNDELGVLEKVLEEMPAMLTPGGRLAVITFHSLEDRLVKTKFKSLTTAPESHPLALPSEIKSADYVLVNRKVITASENELKINPRAESAKLRIIQRRKK